MKNYYKIILSLTILSLMSVGWGQSDDITFSEFDSKGNPINYNPDIINERDLGDFLSSCPIPPHFVAHIDWYDGFLWIAYYSEYDS